MVFRNWIKFIAFSPMLLLLAACGNKEGAKGSQPTNNDTVQSKLPEVSTDPIELSKAYAQNGILADRQFKGKHILVTGFISKINNDSDGNPYITMQSGSFQNHPVFKFDKASVEELTKLKVGEKVSVICLGNGNKDNVPMNESCKLILTVNTEPSEVSSAQTPPPPARRTSSYNSYESARPQGSAPADMNYCGSSPPGVPCRRLPYQSYGYAAPACSSPVCASNIPYRTYRSAAAAAASAAATGYAVGSAVPALPRK